MKESRRVFESEVELDRDKSTKIKLLRRVLKLLKVVFVASRARGLNQPLS